MGAFRFYTVVLAVAFALPGVASGQTTDGVLVADADQVPAESPPPCIQGEIPALTPVKLEILEMLGSKISTSGQTFRIRLAEPVIVGDCQMLAAGAEGMGEVVHAKKAGFGGSAGEFIAAARYLTVGDKVLKLRSLKLVMVGRDSTAHLMGTIALGAVGGAISPVQNSQSKPNVEIPIGTVADAKTAEKFDPFAELSSVDAQGSADVGDLEDSAADQPGATQLELR